MDHKLNESLQNYVIYSVFTRNHTPEGSFQALIADLPRIRTLGVDAIWLMPIHPLGEKARKGSLGSPYANRDYRAINPEFGTLDNFKELVERIHEQDMKCLIDVVYNHTSPDSVLWKEHPEWFYHREDGSPGNHVDDWSDIIDLDYFSGHELWDYQIENLVEWAKLVDGFRCDVASFVPVEFWKEARAAVEQVRPGCIWLAESVHRSFNREMRARGLYCASDTELYEAFDTEYAYDIEEVFVSWLEGKAPLAHYLDLLDFQESIYPRGFNKTRFLENHDTPRIASRLERGLSLENLTAMLFFLKGTTLLYGGQERALTHAPSLFDRDTIDWADGKDLSPLMQKLASIKHNVLKADDVFRACAYDVDELAVLSRENTEYTSFGIFSLAGKSVEITLDEPNAPLCKGLEQSLEVENLIDGKTLKIYDGRIKTDGEPIIFVLPNK